MGIYPLLERNPRDDLCGHRYRLGRHRRTVHVARRPIFQLARWLSMGSVVAASLLIDNVRSWPLAILVGIFGLTMVRASREVSDTTSRAIRHGLEEDLANASLLQAKEAAEAANIAKSQFLATDEPRDPHADERRAGLARAAAHSSSTRDQRRLVNTAASSGESLMEILNDVLDHSKIEAGKLNLAHVRLSLHALAASVIALFRANAEAQGAALAPRPRARCRRLGARRRAAAEAGAC